MINFSSSVDQVVRRWPTPEARRWVIDFLREVSESEGALAVIALGSAVRPSVESEDLDLLMVCKDGRKSHWRAPIEIDLRAYQVSDVEKELASGGDLLTWAVKYGVALLDRGCVWTEIVNSWKHRLQLPDPEVAERRADLAHTQFEALEEVGDSAAANEVHVSCLTYRARAALSRSGTFPASRPELADQLREIGEYELAKDLDSALAKRQRMASENAAV